MGGAHPGSKGGDHGQYGWVRTVLEAMGEGFALFAVLYDEWDQPLVFRDLELNSASEKLMGARREQVVGKTMLELYPDVEPYWPNVRSSCDDYGRADASMLTGAS